MSSKSMIMMFTAVTFLYFILFMSILAHADCSRDINELSPLTKQKFLELKKEANKYGINIKAICTYRSPQEQGRLYQQGRTKTGNRVTWVKASRHSQRTAFDIAIFNGSKVSWSPGTYKRLGDISKRLGGLTWGGDWRERDYGHFELTKEIK